MTKTREDLIARALKKLGAVGAGQSPAPEDTQEVDGSIEPILSDLAQRNVYVWGDPDQVEDEAFEHLAEILANANARIFGKEPDENVRLLAERRLRNLNLAVLSGQPQTTEYY